MRDFPPTLGKRATKTPPLYTEFCKRLRFWGKTGDFGADAGDFHSDFTATMTATFTRSRTTMPATFATFPATLAAALAAIHARRISRRRPPRPRRRSRPRPHHLSRPPPGKATTDQGRRQPGSAPRTRQAPEQMETPRHKAINARHRAGGT